MAIESTSDQRENGVQRCFVLKKKEHDREGERVLRIIHDQLRCETVTGVRSAVRYDVEDIDAPAFKRSRETIFTEAPVDEECDPDAFEAFTQGKTVIGIEALPGQYEQRSDFTEQSVQILTGGERPTARTAQFYILDGSIRDDELNRLKAYLINTTDSREAAAKKPQTLHEKLPEPPDVRTLDGFTHLDEKGLTKLRKECKLAMTLADLRCVRDAFQAKQRDPTVTELRVLDTYWSDHCRHTTFTTELVDIALCGRTLFKDGRWIADTETSDESFVAMVQDELYRFVHEHETLLSGRVWNAERPLQHPPSLMELALHSMREAKAQGRLEDMEVSEENNAASIIVPVSFADSRTEEWLFMFKNETHNHPTEIEGVGGAATCIGGAIRDPLSGRAYVFFGMRVSGSGDPREPLEQTLPGKHPQRKITTDAARGYAGYGNQIGVPTLKVGEFYHSGFKAKRLELGFVGGAVKREHVRRERPMPGDIVILIGGRTGRDGIGGATGSSKPHDASSIAHCGAEVQKGNPPEERKLQRFMTAPAISRRIKRSNDLGAGGIIVGVGELADGVDINLDPVPLKYHGLDGTEIGTSEAQERMVVVIAAEDEEEFIKAAAEENLEATAIATVTAEERMVLRWRGKEICNLDRPLLKDGWAKREAAASITAPDITSLFELPSELRDKDFDKQWLDNLNRLNVCSKRGLQDRFDSTVGAQTVVSPFGGPRQLSPSDAAVAAFPAEGSLTATAASYGYDPDLAEKSSLHGALYAVVESLARLVASGASYDDARLTLQNYFGSPGSDPERWAKPLLAQLGARIAQRELGTPAIGGKDSMSGNFTDSAGNRIDVPPTIVSFAVKPMDRTHAVTSSLQKSGSILVLLHARRDGSGLPEWNELKTMWSRVSGAMRNGRIASAHAVGAGGAAAAVTEMMMGSNFGCTIDVPEDNPDDCFTASYGSLVVEVPWNFDPEHMFSGLPFIVLGRVTDQPGIRLKGAERIVLLTRETLRHAWEEPLSQIFPAEPDDPGTGEEIYQSSFTVRQGRAADLAKVARPHAAVLTFPGTNCEIETACAFTRARAEAKVHVFTNRTKTDIVQSIERYAAAIRNAQILVFPGGFSAGDEPDGSGKFMATILRSPQLSDAVHRFLDRGGLILGICNGFQGLIKSCLLPRGKVDALHREDATLTHNTIGRYLSRFARHRVTSVLSPWMSEFEPGELVDFPIAHGEGRLIQLPGSAWRKGQIPFQYVEEEGIARMLFPDNPNGSEDAAAALTDPSGRIFGMMAHPERALPGLSVNIPGERNGMKIFHGGVGYFS